MPVTFEQFVAAAAPRLVRAARMLLGGGAEAEDMVQETLIVMHRQWARLRNPDAAQSYAYRTLVRLTRRHLRSARVRHESPDGAAPAEELQVADPLGENHADLAPALARLPTRQREAVVLRYFLDLSIDDTARVMRCTQGTVKSQVHKALATLRVQLQHPDQPTPTGQP